MGRLLGDAAMARLAAAHVMIVGVGGVGSWAAESLARSGIGQLTLMDFDDVCITNVNRQLHALDGSVGQPKAEVMAERLRRINPRAEVRALPAFYSRKTPEQVLDARPDFVIDAIDSVTSKCNLLATCHKHGIHVVTSTGSGGRLDPARIEVADLFETDVDPLARMVRKLLRRHYGFGDGPFGIPAVFSREPPARPRPLACDGGKGFRCVCAPSPDAPLTCDRRNLILGSASFVTGAFGLHCAAIAVHALLGVSEPPAAGVAS